MDMIQVVFKDKHNFVLAYQRLPSKLTEHIRLYVCALNYLLDKMKNKDIFIENTEQTDHQLIIVSVG